MIKIGKRQNYFSVMILSIYFCTKILWDTISFGITEYISLLFIVAGVLLYCNKIKRTEILFLEMYILFSVYILFNGFILTDSAHLIRGIYEYIYYGAIFFSILGYLKRMSFQDYDSILTVLAYVGVLLGILTIIEYFRGEGFIAGGAENSYGTYISGYGYTFRPKVFTRSYLSHGLIMAIMALLTLYKFRTTDKRKWLVYYGICVIGVILTSSRGPLVSCVIASILLLYDRVNLKKIKRKTFLVGVFFTVILAFGFYVICYSDVEFSNSTIQYFVTRIRNIFNWSSDAGNVGRIIRWQNYVKYFFEHNVWVGDGVSRTGSSGVTSIMGTTESGVLKRLVELGIIGIVLFYSYIVIILNRSVQSARKKNDESYMLNRLAFASVICILIDDLTLQVTEEIMISFYLWFFMALLYASNYRHEMS